MFAWRVLNLALFVAFCTQSVDSKPETDDVAKPRQKRFLLFPRANPGRLQLIGGFGIPVDIQLESITVGYVFKSVYYLPWNSSHFTPPFLDRHELETQRAHDHNRRNAVPTPLLLPPTDNYERYGEQRQDLGSESLPDSKESRWMFYQMLEQLFQQRGFNGRSCVLRAICESSEASFTHTSGLIGELLHIAFTPSATNDVLREPHHELYRMAEIVPRSVSGRSGGSVCANMFSECDLSLLDSFSSVFHDLISTI
ncbi:uncharacterized protein LOC128724018 [Anopheles nili]|uniref:uncharacterized protein LOC128724018 n=1 Tax=Anopheles nili TaxID=185578 RepID=UPI00237AA8B2|nr:uncharacterized protein LOC128724018 [Anopheles nili]